MSIFGKIMDAIFGKAKAADAGTAGAGAGGGSAGGATMSQVDVEQVVSDLAKQKKEKLDWRKSRFRQDEYLAAQAGDEQARGQWRQGSGRPQGLTIPVSRKRWRRPGIAGPFLQAAARHT
jgi:hypothetical protein